MPVMRGGASFPRSRASSPEPGLTGSPIPGTAGEGAAQHDLSSSTLGSQGPLW